MKTKHRQCSGEVSNNAAIVKKGANCSKRELTLRMADTSRNEKWKKECCCVAADINRY
jgi:hypothetical protein